MLLLVLGFVTNSGEWSPKGLTTFRSVIFSLSLGNEALKGLLRLVPNFNCAIVASTRQNIFLRRMPIYAITVLCMSVVFNMQYAQTPQFGFVHYVRRGLFKNMNFIVRASGGYQVIELWPFYAINSATMISGYRT